MKSSMLLLCLLVAVGCAYSNSSEAASSAPLEWKTQIVVADDGRFGNAVAIVPRLGSFYTHGDDGISAPVSRPATVDRAPLRVRRD